MQVETKNTLMALDPECNLRCILEIIKEIWGKYYLKAVIPPRQLNQYLLGVSEPC
jgi:hypothetical protein